MKVLVVDDEPYARARLRRLLAVHPDLVVVAEAQNGNEALVAIERYAPDLVFLDVEMPGKDGLAVADELVGLGVNRPAVVFTTAHSRFALDAFESEADDYLLKPIIAERLARALAKVRRHRAAPFEPPPRAGEHQLVVQEGATVRLFDGARVTRFWAVDKYTAFLDGGDEHLLREGLSALEARLGGAGFMRVHRAELIRLDAVSALEPDAAGGGIAHLSDGQRVQVSRRTLPALRRALGIRGVP